MTRADLTLGDLATRDHAFYGLVWAGTTLSAHVDRALVRGHGLTLSWFEVMLWLNAQSEPVAASDLGAKTLLSRTQASRVVDALHERGLVAREQSPTDGRSWHISLTRAGRDAFAAADATRRAALAEVFDDLLDDEDVAALERAWLKLKAGRAAQRAEG
jgi:DNA-binding MarR family transcriptional regulator